MRTAFKRSFAKDLTAVRDKKLLLRIRQLIEHVELAGSLSEVTGLKKLHARAVTIACV